MRDSRGLGEVCAANLKDREEFFTKIRDQREQTISAER
jgi:hypothetical protein